MMVFRARPLVRRVVASSVIAALSVAFAPTPGTAADRHCATQTGMQASMPAMEHSHHAPPASPGDRSINTQHECDHCPPAECASHELCGGTISAAWPAARSARDPGIPRKADALVWNPSYSQDDHPPTPPPTVRL